VRFESVERARQAAYARLNSLTKPPGSLGRLESLAVQLCQIQRTLPLQAERAILLLFAADHGLALEGVSAYPRAVTAQMVHNFLAGGAAANVLARANNCELRVIDAGVDAEFPAHPNLVHGKIAHGTSNILQAPAMSAEQLNAALALGARQVDHCVANDFKIILLGEMGIGNTAIAAALLAQMTQWPVSSCVGPGTGLDTTGVQRKTAILEQAIALHGRHLQADSVPQKVLAWLQYLGGFEIAALVGAAQRASERGVAILVDGFIVSVAVALAEQLSPGVLQHCIFAHCSAEPAHVLLLDHLKVEPLLNLQLRLGEGSGALLALPIVRSAAKILNEMATFSSAGVSGAVNAAP
jgi:nicotinate-nucleotide--dimethylbenzimidazole phosphoribosyltransferase